MAPDCDAVALGIAELDRSWIAFGIAILWAPALNGVLLLVGVVATLRQKKRHPTLPVAAFVLLTIGGPVIICAGVSALIFALGLHGC